MSLTPAALHRRHRGRTRGHRGDCSQLYPHPCHHPGPCGCSHPCRAPPPHTCKANCPRGAPWAPGPASAHWAGPSHCPEHGAHRELCWAVPGCWGGRRLLLGRGQRQRFQPQRAAVRLCRTTPCPVSHLCGPHTSGSDTPGPLPALPCSCWHEALTQHSSPESPVPAQPKFQRCVRVPRARPAGTEH